MNQKKQGLISTKNISINMEKYVKMKLKFQKYQTYH